MIYVFGQNNSGGYFIQNEVVSNYVAIQAGSKEKAIQAMDEISDGYSQYCSCCGRRWSTYPDYEFKELEEYKDWKNGTGESAWWGGVNDEYIRFYEFVSNSMYKIKESEGENE